MQRIIILFLLCFNLAPSFTQAQRKVSSILSGQYTKTIYDRTKGSNPGGLGLGLQLFLNTPFSNKPSKLKGAIDFTVDIFPGGDKVLRLNPDGSEIATIKAMVNAFAGASYHPTERVYISLVAGPSFVSGQTLLGIKPSCGFFIDPDKKFSGRIAFINVFDRHKLSQQDFGAVSISFGAKLF